jgi:hypothetical protein
MHSVADDAALGAELCLALHVLQLTAATAISLVMQARRLDAMAAAFAQCEHVASRESAVSYELHVDDIPWRRSRHEDGQTIAVCDTVAAGGDGFDANLRDHGGA